MAIVMDEYIDLANFVRHLALTLGTGYFRGLKVRCEHRLGGHKWTVYGKKTRCYTSYIGWDEVDGVADWLIHNGALSTEVTQP